MKLLILAFILFFILVAGGIGVYFYITANKAGTESQSQTVPPPTPTATTLSEAQTTSAALQFPAICVKGAKPTSLPTNCTTTNPVVSDYAGTGYAGSQQGSRLTAASFNRPTGIAFHPDGSLIIGDNGGFRNISGDVVRHIRLSRSVCAITHFTIDSSGFIYAPVVCGGVRSYIIDVDATFNATAVSATLNATLLAGSQTVWGTVDSTILTNATFSSLQQTLISNGEIYAINYPLYQQGLFPTGVYPPPASIRVINTCLGDTDYGVRTLYTFPPSAHPRSLAFDSNGDACNHKLTVDISVINTHCITKLSNGVVTACFAGTGVAGMADGPSGEGNFNNPYGLAFGKCGNLFVADSGNK